MWQQWEDPNDFEHKFRPHAVRDRAMSQIRKEANADLDAVLKMEMDNLKAQLVGGGDEKKGLILLCLCCLLAFIFSLPLCRKKGKKGKGKKGFYLSIINHITFTRSHCNWSYLLIRKGKGKKGGKGKKAKEEAPVGSIVATTIISLFLTWCFYTYAQLSRQSKSRTQKT